MRFIQCARHKGEQNLYVFQYYGSIYYRAFKDIPVGSELMVWYDEKYPQFFGLPMEIRDMSSCSVESELNMMNHIFIIHNSVELFISALMLGLYRWNEGSQWRPTCIYIQARVVHRPPFFEATPAPPCVRVQFYTTDSSH